MKKITLFSVCFLLIVASCQQKAKELTREELRHTIDSIEAPVRDAVLVESVDTAVGNNLVRLYVQYGDRFPEDSLSALYISRAAEISLSMGNIDDMVTYFDRVINEYPDFDHLDECYYTKAVALDNAGRRQEARAAYEAFLEVYPDHFLAEDIRKAIPLLDKSDQWLNDNYFEK